MIAGFLCAIDTLTRWTGRILSFLIIILGGLLLVEVIARFIFKSPISWSIVVATKIFGYYLILGGGYVLLEKAHVKMDLLWSRFSPRQAAIVDLSTSAFAFLFLGAMLWSGGEVAWESLRALENTAPPIIFPVYPSKVALVIATILFLLQLIAKFIRDCYTASRGRLI